MNITIRLVVVAFLLALTTPANSPVSAQVNEVDPVIIIVDGITHPVEMIKPDPENPVIDKDDDTNEFQFEGDVDYPLFGKPDHVWITIEYPDRPLDTIKIPVDNTGHFEGVGNIFGDGNATISIQPYKERPGGDKKLGDPTEFEVTIM